MEKKHLIIDFYAYEFLYNCPKNIPIIYLEKYNNWKWKLEKEVEKFILNLKTELLSILEYSIITEFTHIWKYTNFKSKNIKKQIGSTAFHVLEDSMPLVIGFLQPFHSQNPLFENCQEKGRFYKQVLESKLTPQQFISSTKILFKSLNWIDDWGGFVWFNISNEYLKLCKTKNIKELFIQCDRIFCIQHNTNTIFNKIPIWSKNGNYDWIFNLLNWRKELQSPWDMYKYLYKSKPTFSEGLFLNGWGTLEEWKLEGNEIHYQKRKQWKNKMEILKEESRKKLQSMSYNELLKEFREIKNYCSKLNDISIKKFNNNFNEILLKIEEYNTFINNTVEENNINILSLLNLMKDDKTLENVLISISNDIKNLSLNVKTNTEINNDNITKYKQQIITQIDELFNTLKQVIEKTKEQESQVFKEFNYYLKNLKQEQILLKTEIEEIKLQNEKFLTLLTEIKEIEQKPLWKRIF